MGGSDRLNGQWVGSYGGSSPGKIVVNIDEREANYRGVAYLLDDDSSNPGSAAFFSTPNKESKFNLRTDPILAIDRPSGEVIPFEGLASKIQEGIKFPKYADVKGSLEQDALTLSWITDIETIGNCVLPRSKANKPSELVPMELDWGTYKQHVCELLPKRYLFRGQDKPWRLRTVFHRAGRADLHRYLRDDIPAVHRHLSARTRHVFNLEIGDQNGAFFNLVQHHGYPTPLLDWTYSPYVAAFFAYRGISNEQSANANQNERVRILVFDQAQWKEDLDQLLYLIRPALHLSLHEFIAIENERMIPQQAASMITNADDIEAYIRSKETAAKKYLGAIDLPVSERRHVMRELSYMGITAGSLFPGLDGACEELKERNFGI
jgi:hypothetical protein